MRCATKSPGEREDEEASRLVRPAPHKKPPRRDKRRELMQLEREGDPDLESKDTSLNYKVIGGSVARVVARYLVRQAAGEQGTPPAQPPRPRKKGDLIPARNKATGEKVNISPETLKAEPDKYEKWEIKKDKGNARSTPTSSPPASTPPPGSTAPAAAPVTHPPTPTQGSPGPTRGTEPEDQDEGDEPDEEAEEEEEEEGFDEAGAGDDQGEEDAESAEPVAKQHSIKKPPRPKVTAAERAETTLFLSDHLPPEVAAKFIAARIHPEDAKTLVENYRAAQSRTMGNLAEFARKVGKFFETNPDAVEPPATWVNRKGRKVPFENLKPKDKAVAYRQHQLQVVAMSLAAEDQLQKKLSFEGRVPPKLAKSVTRALIRGSVENVDEAAAKVFAATAEEPGRGVKIADGDVNRILAAAGTNADARKLLQSYLEANDYKQAKYLFLSRDGGLSERDTPADITNGIRSAREFFRERGRVYGQPDTHEGAKRFETKTLAHLKRLAPKKYEAVRTAIDKDDAEAYERLNKLWQQYDKKAEAWATRADNKPDEEPPKPPSGRRPVKPMGASSAASGKHLTNQGRKLWRDLLKRADEGNAAPAPSRKGAPPAPADGPNTSTPPSQPSGGAPAGQARGGTASPAQGQVPPKKTKSKRSKTAASAASVASKYLNSTYPSLIPMDQSSPKRALYHGIDPAVHYPRTPYSRGEQIPIRTLDESDFDEILRDARSWLQFVDSPDQALELVLQTSAYRVDIQTYEILLARLQGDRGRVSKFAFEDRTKLEKAIFARFPPDSRQRKGGDLVVMLTGDTASALKRNQYDLVPLAKLDDTDLERLARALRIRTARASTFGSAPTITPLRETEHGAIHMLRLSSDQKATANEVLSQLDGLAQSIQTNRQKWGMSFEAAKKLVNHLDRIADQTEALVFGEQSLQSRQAEVAVLSDEFRTDALNDGLVSRSTLAKAAKVLQRDADEPYMDTFKNPMSPHETDSDEPYMAAYGDDQSSAVVEGEDDTGRELAPEA